MSSVEPFPCNDTWMQRHEGQFLTTMNAIWHLLIGKQKMLLMCTHVMQALLSLWSCVFCACGHAARVCIRVCAYVFWCVHFLQSKQAKSCSVLLVPASAASHSRSCLVCTCVGPVWCAHALYMRFETLQCAVFCCVVLCHCLVCKYMRFESCVLLYIRFENWLCAVFCCVVWFSCLVCTCVVHAIWEFAMCCILLCWLFLQHMSVMAHKCAVSEHVRCYACALALAQQFLCVCMHCLLPIVCWPVHSDTMWMLTCCVGTVSDASICGSRCPVCILRAMFCNISSFDNLMFCHILDAHRSYHTLTMYCPKQHPWVTAEQAHDTLWGKSQWCRKWH